jgi:hypothetical protein
LMGAAVYIQGQHGFSRQICGVSPAGREDFTCGPGA